MTPDCTESCSLTPWHEARGNCCKLWIKWDNNAYQVMNFIKEAKFILEIVFKVGDQIWNVQLCLFSYFIQLSSRKPRCEFLFSLPPHLLVTELITKAFEKFASSTKYFKLISILLNTRLIVFMQKDIILNIIEFWWLTAWLACECLQVTDFSFYKFIHNKVVVISLGF